MKTQVNTKIETVSPARYDRAWASSHTHDGCYFPGKYFDKLVPAVTKKVVSDVTLTVSVDELKTIRKVFGPTPYYDNNGLNGKIYDAVDAAIDNAEDIAGVKAPF